MGLGAIALVFGLLMIYLAIFTILVSLIGIGVSLFNRATRLPYYLAVGSSAFLSLALLMILKDGSDIAILVMAPSTALTAINFLVWKSRHRPPTPSSNKFAPYPLIGPRTLATIIIVGALISSCGVMQPLFYVMGYLTYGRGPSDIRVNDITIGETADSVRHRFGKPHDQDEREGKQTWYYLTDSLLSETVRVSFDANSRVEGASMLD
jgi:hypothetical protein